VPSDYRFNSKEVMSDTLEQKRAAYPLFSDRIPGNTFESGNYALRFARDNGDLDAVQRLRFEVFNEELGEGLEASRLTGRDEDEYDPTCHHLVVTERSTGLVVGTYRMQSLEMAEGARGFYSSTEFDLTTLPREFLSSAIELGRACIHADHRHGRVLFLLWRGLAAYLKVNGKRYFFGCCSLTSQDENEGLRMMSHLAERGHLHPSLSVQPRPDFVCHPTALAANDTAPVRIPKLMRLYIEYGALICGGPAIDRVFKTIDYLALYDLETMSEKVRKMFPG
jgi:putative hemolysin